MNGWVEVVFAADCDEDGDCPKCAVDYAECQCPGPTQEEEYEYEEFDGTLFARRLDHKDKKMDINTYSKLAMRTMNHDDPIGNACFGIGGEAGEILDLMKKTRYHDKPLDPLKLKAEIGDLMWYINVLVVEMGFEWGDVLSTNIKKLEARYPDMRFDAERANNRDLDAEQAAMRS